MRRYIVLLLITGTVWAQTDFDKLVLDDGRETLGENSYIEENIVYFKQTNGLAFQGVPVLDYENLSLKGKAIFNAKKESRKWILYPPATFSIFVSSIYGTQIIARKEAREYPATLGISASLTIPYLLLRALTSKKTENFNSKDKQLYEKVYFKEHKKRKYKNIIISTGVTALTACGVIYSLLDNMSFGPGAFGSNNHCCF